MAGFDAFAPFRMTGHAVVMTGGARNIDAGIATTLTGAGARVMIADLNGDKAAETARAISSETGGECRGMTYDVTDDQAVAKLVAATAEASGGISTPGNNVGWGGRQPDPTAIPDAEFLRAFELNRISAYRMSMACLPWLEKAQNATITNSGSFSAALPAYDILPYATAKAALDQMMVSLAHLLNRKVRVNSVLVGTIVTPGYADAGIDPAVQEHLAHPDNLVGRASRPEAIANAMLWLCSPASGWVSGQIINVHGGGSVVRLFGS